MKKLLATSLALVTFATVCAEPANAQHCNVQRGESIYRIAKEYHLDFARLLELNKHLKNPHLIYPNQKIETHADKGTGNTETPNKSDKTSESNVTRNEQDASDVQAEQVLALVNKERLSRGLNPLKLDSELNRVAAAKSKDMGENDYFSHDSPTYGSPFDMMHTFGIDYRSAGENIAAGQRSAADVMNSWMNSSGHRANILNKDYQYLGVGYYAGGSYGTYWTQEFIGK